MVICPARGIGSYRLPDEWHEPLRLGRLKVVSPFADRIYLREDRDAE